MLLRNHTQPRPPDVVTIIQQELGSLNHAVDYVPPAQNRQKLFDAIGPSTLATYDPDWRRGNTTQLPNWTTADRARIQTLLITAKKLIPLWEVACLETDRYFNRVGKQNKEQETIREQAYLSQRQQLPIEEMPSNIPRKYRPQHVIDMTETALAGNIQNVKAFLMQTNEYWNSYPRPEGYEREYYIHWACMEALYRAVNMSTPAWPQALAKDAEIAYAGVFTGAYSTGPQTVWDIQKRNQFWVWWLQEAIPQGFNMSTN